MNQDLFSYPFPFHDERGRTLIYMRNAPGKTDTNVLFWPLPIKLMDGTPSTVPIGFEWDGSSVPSVFRNVFPKWRHPIASCRHDRRCSMATNAKERLFADIEFMKDVARVYDDSKTFNGFISHARARVESLIGFAGVRVGAALGVGVHYNHWTKTAIIWLNKLIQWRV